jgi:hypothetical protein
MTATLIRRKLLGRYYVVAVDGTGFFTSAERRGPQCLTRTDLGHTTYYHPVLEAKLITPSGGGCHPVLGWLRPQWANRMIGVQYSRV